MVIRRTMGVLGCAAGIAALLALVVPNADAQDQHVPRPDAPAKGSDPADRELVWSADTDGAEVSSAGVSAAAVPAQADLEFVAFSTGCRIFDTRYGGGAFNAGQSRDLSVLDASIPAQGGVAGGCGIPAYAVAVDMSLSTTGGSPTNVGFVQVGPGGVAPNATVLQFLKGQGTSVTTSAPLATNSKMRIKVNGAQTHLVGDVLGYWKPAMHISLGDDGSVFAASGVVDVAKDPSFAGDYYVQFQQDLSLCSAVAAPSYFEDTRVYVAISGDVVFVDGRAFDSLGEADTPIELIVKC